MPGANAAAGKIRRGVVQRRARHRIGYRQRLNIVEPAVVAFQRQRVDGRQTAPQFRVAANGVAHQRGKQCADRQGITEQDRRLQASQLFNLHQPHRFGEAVKHRGAAG